MSSRRLRILYVVNFPLPEGDYRLAYGRLSDRCRITYGLPEPPPADTCGEYVRMGFGEGLSLRDLANTARLPGALSQAT